MKPNPILFLIVVLLIFSSSVGSCADPALPPLPHIPPMPPAGKPPTVVPPMLNISDIYQETAWISLDLPKEQREKIDAIIASKSTEAKKLLRNTQLENIVLVKNPVDNVHTIDLLNFLKVMQQIDDIRSDINSAIEQNLSPDQQDQFENQLSLKQRQVAGTVSVLLALKLDDLQQAKIMNMLLQSQLEVWTIVSNDGISWEQRRKKIQLLSTFQQLLILLTKDQQNVLSSYLTSSIPSLMLLGD